MFNNKKSKRGFSLVELMVVVAIMGTLAAIAIPAYNEYRKSAKKASYKADLTSLHKGWLAFGVELDSFCKRDTTPEDASVRNVGMISLFSSKLYGDNPKKSNFIGFGGSTATLGCFGATAPFAIAFANATHIEEGNTAPAATAVVVGIGSTGASPAVAQSDNTCVLDISSYTMGTFGHVSGNDYYGANITNDGVLEDKDVSGGSLGTNACS